MVKLAFISAVAASLLAVRADDCVTIQYPFPAGQGGNSTRADAVKEEYRYVWAEYAKYAFGQDDLLPISHAGTNDLFGWGATIVDGIDTAVVMGLTDIVTSQLAWIASVDFSSSAYIVDEFDAMIRYIGGLLSAYDLINSKLVPSGTYDPANVTALLTAATNISDHLKPMFNTSSGLPLANINFTSEQASNCNPIEPCDASNTAVDTAICGTLILEWYRLSDLTNDSSYRELAQRTEANLISPDQDLIYPNIVGSSLDVNTGKYTNNYGGWQGGIDSFYEYLIKTYVYAPTEPSTVDYKDYWVGTVNSTMKYLASHPFEHPELTFISQTDNNGELEYAMDDYACFAGGNLLLGGRYLNDSDVFDFGLAVTDSCHSLFNTSAAGLNPFAWSWFNATNQTYTASDAQSPANVAYANKAGFYVTDAGWGAFPEPIESMWYAYRLTGDAIWQEYIWDAFEAMLRDTRRNSSEAFAQLSDVTQPLGGALQDYVPSFFFAEVLKYFYLTFADPMVVSLDEYVFNTECHPVNIQSGTCATS
ncbi:putative mannosyl-oligosaccharide alpha-1,2-mannosidase [Lachnellula suecica]|uniref:alpha-1,2-Mannosidase n=1 Tax=Lachnellula suecica TaxID=602035 RepID=A0A8T9BX56_9HELO|nr:putative mannosyl-oligosaccharide alpha-1,2-mannosidase [Lachnellula suecica]